MWTIRSKIMIFAVVFENTILRAHWTDSQKIWYFIWIMFWSFEFADVDLQRSTSDLSKSETIVWEFHEFTSILILTVLRAHWTDFRNFWCFIWIMFWSFEFTDVDFQRSTSDLSKFETIVTEIYEFVVNLILAILRVHWFDVGLRIRFTQILKHV